DGKTEAEVVLHITPFENGEELVTNKKIVIDGPGDYEIMDVAITGVSHGDFMGYIIDDDTTRVLIAPSHAIDKVKDEEGFAALILKAVAAVDIEKITSFAPDICIVLGDPMLLDHATDAKKITKVNVRKVDETLKGQVVVLQKE
ncbi:MAG TPA: hypothetical protein PLD54_01900, partial [Candidatus Levybacteria bacterium]|nr:hypothetical protein [Candidatus Levybacteria bacterium]